MAWRWEITERDGTALAEVQNASVRKLTQQLSKSAVANFTILSHNPIVEDLYGEDRLLKVYQDDTLRFHGPITSLEATNGDHGATVAATATDPSFYFAKRVVGKSPTGTTYTTQDKLVIVKSLIDIANNVFLDGAETGVRTSSMTCGSTATYVAGPYRLLDECIAELGDTLDGFDWRIDPIEYDTGKIGDFTAAALLQNTQADAVFEYGPDTRANVDTFNYQRLWTDMANRVFNVPQDLTLDAVLDAADNTSITDHGLHEALVDSTDVTNLTLRQQVADFHVAVRKDPRRIVTFTPTVEDPDRPGKVPTYGEDYYLGDLVPVRIAPEGIELISGLVRIHKMEIELDQSGRAKYTPTTVPE